MLKDELLEIIANGENSGMEFKRDDLRPEQLAKEVVAMVNFQGGTLLLGVEDDGAISGVQRDQLEEWVMNVVQSKIHPMILPFYETIQVDDKQVARINFPQGISKPYVVRDKGSEKIYIRVGSTSREATREQQMRLFELGGMLHTEVMPVPQTGYSDLDEARIENYLKDILSDHDLPTNETEWIARLSGLGFLTEAGEQICCTVAGLVLFGKNPRRYLKQSGIRLFAFAGEDKEYQALIDDIQEGALVGRWDLSSSGKRLVDAGMVEKFIDKITPFVSQQGNKINDGFRRETHWFYPMDAVREVVLNALAHRDWTRFVDIEIGIYNNRMEIISPGTLQNSMSIEKMVAGQRSPRNPIIMEVLRDYGYVDHRGMGIRTKVIPLMKKLNHVDPVFEVTEDYLKVTLLREQAENESE